MKTTRAIAAKDNTIDVAKQCLVIIRNVAARGATSWNPEHVGFALQELSQVLFERTGTPGRIFEPMPADEIRDVHLLRDELDFVDGYSRHLAMRDVH